MTLSSKNTGHTPQYEILWVTHYMKRMYRSMFYCALEDMYMVQHRLHAFKVFTQHLKKLVVAFFKYHKE